MLNILCLQMSYWILYWHSERNLKVHCDLHLCPYLQFYFCILVCDSTHFFLSLYAEQYNVKVSVNDIVLKAVALALKTVPEANGKDSKYYSYSYIWCRNFKSEAYHFVQVLYRYTLSLAFKISIVMGGAGSNQGSKLQYQYRFWSITIKIQHWY